MINIRKNLFETNSSSVHSLTMCDENDWNDWLSGKKFFCPNNDTFYDNNERIAYMKRKKLLEDYFKYDWKTHTFEYDGQTYDIMTRYEIAEKFAHIVSDAEAEEFYEHSIDDIFDIPVSYEQYTDHVDEWYESFKDEYKTKDGSTVIAFGYYGHD